jgi:hypothetical protein
MRGAQAAFQTLFAQLCAQQRNKADGGVRSHATVFEISL